MLSVTTCLWRRCGVQALILHPTLAVREPSEADVEVVLAHLRRVQLHRRKTFHIERLPDETLALVLSFLDARSLLACEASCQRVLVVGRSRGKGTHIARLFTTVALSRVTVPRVS